jgi:hypothetical protein
MRVIYMCPEEIFSIPLSDPDMKVVHDRQCSDPGKLSGKGCNSRRENDVSSCEIA